MFSIGGVYVVGALVLSVRRFAGGLLSSGATYGVATLLVVLLSLTLRLRLVELFSGKSLTHGDLGAVDADCYTKVVSVGSHFQASVSYWGRPSLMW